MRQSMVSGLIAAQARVLIGAAIVATLAGHHFATAVEGAKAEPLVLALTVGAPGGTELHQEIVVAEDRDFRVVTQGPYGHWYVAGHVGPIVDGVAHVRLKYGVSVTEAWNVGTTWLDLPIDGFASHGGGVIHGPYHSGLWLRRGLDPVPVLIRSVASRDKYYRSAVGRLGELGARASAAVPELIKVLNDRSVDRDLRPYKSARRYAAQSLGEISSSAIAAVDSLLQAMRDDNPYVRLASALALWKIAARPEAVEVAIEHLDDEDNSVRHEAASALREIGAGAQPAVPALTKGLSDPNSWMRCESAWALWAIRRDPAALACLRDVSENDADPKVRRFASSLRSEIETQQTAEQSSRDGAP